MGYIHLSDTLPAGLVMSTPNGFTGSSCNGTLVAVAGTNSVSLGEDSPSNAGNLSAGDSCTFSVNVTGTTVGTKNNTASTINSDGPPSDPASATLIVDPVTPPAFTKSFGAAHITVGGSASLSFTITNRDASTPFTGVAFADTLPAGLVISTPSNGLTGSCGGGTITATAGSGSLSLTGATLAALASCTFSVNVTGTTTGFKVNITSQLLADQYGPGGLIAAASLTVDPPNPPTIGESFGAANIPVGGTTVLLFTITNPNAYASLTGVAFTDTLPAGLIPNSVAGLCGGGAFVVNTTSGFVGLTGATLTAGTSCSFLVSVTGTTVGTKVSTTGAVTSNETGAGGTASASLVVQPLGVPVLSPPALAGLALLLAGLGWVFARKGQAHG